MAEIKAPKKLIEVALPLDDINVAAAKEKSIRHGHPSTLHLWWARRPLAAARAVLFAQLVNDPGYEQGTGFKRGVNKEKAAKERERLFGIIRELVKWENTNNEGVLKPAREEIWKSWRETCALNKEHPQAKELFNPEKLPAFHDPFAGGGTIPLEAQRLGLEAYASDLNPVAVTINKAMIEIPPKFANCPPVGPKVAGEVQTLLHEKWVGSKGLAEDVRRYGAWMQEEAYKRIGHLYPQIEITKEVVKERPDLKNLLGQKLTIIAWIWAKTVKSPNPIFSNVEVPLATTFVLSSRPGKEAYLRPIVDGAKYRFTVELGKPPIDATKGTKPAGRGSTFECIVSKSPIDGKYIKAQGQAGHIGQKLMAMVVESAKGRIYLAPDAVQETVVSNAVSLWKPDQELVGKTRDQLPLYGMVKFWQVFSPRQLVALTTFSDLISEVKEKILQDAIKFGLSNDKKSLESGGTGAMAYAEAICVYLSLGVGRSANYWSSFTPWGGDFIVQTFGRQALAMVWDYAEGNPFSDATGNWLGALEWIEKVMIYSFPITGKGIVFQSDAQNQTISNNKLISTDPPYYSNICYADLSDFFYIWLRRSLKPIFPELYATMAVPKEEELIASPYRHDSKKEAENFFLEGMTKAIRNLAEQAHPAFPVTIYYAFKQAETDAEDGTSSTGWETFLEAVLRAGFAITSTWPMRTERDQGMKTGTNVLASCIILICRKRSIDAPTVSRREFLRELDAVLPEALVEMTCGGEHSLAPVDLSQALIGPGMAVFSKYSAALEADGKPMTVRTALQLINRFFAEDDFDHDTQFCLHWFETVGWNEGIYGDAEVLTKAKGTSVDGLKEAGVIFSGGGKVRLLKWTDYSENWSPETDLRLPIWEALHHLIRALHTGGETAAGTILGKLGARIEAVRQLAYRLFTLCERKGWAEDARAYNELIATWQAIEAVTPKTTEKQMEMF
jgi:putative DNA methylase